MSTTQWFRVASHTDKSFLPQRVGCPPGQPFPLLIHRHSASSVVYRLSGTALSRGLSGQALRKCTAPGRCLTAIRADRSVSRLPLLFGCLGHFHCFGRVKRDFRCREDWSVSRSPNLTFALVVSPIIMMSVSRQLSAISICIRKSVVRITVQEVRHPGATDTATACLESGAFGVPGSAPYRAQAHIAPLPASSASRQSLPRP